MLADICNGPVERAAGRVVVVEVAGGPLLDVVDCCGGTAEWLGDAHAARSEPMAMTMETEMTALPGRCRGVTRCDV
jgi:hypothetical protein